ncbi:NB-ARC domain-containing protein, partial [Azospirillum griseum]
MTLPGDQTTASAPGAVAINGDAPNAVINPTIHLPAPPVPPTAFQQLPGDLPEFVGRDAELATLTAALDKDGGATVVIAAVQGMGGVGKTTLAQHAAQRLTHRYDRQIVVDLNGHGVGAPTAPLDAMMHVIRAFHPETPALTDPAQARAIYRATLSGKKALILLDNAADTDQIRDLIPPPHCGALITARTLVQPPGCPRPLTLGLLPLADSVALLRTLAPDATGTEDQWTRLAELCGRLPLALRVAGATLAAAIDLTLSDYLTELADEGTRPHRLFLDGDSGSNVAAILRHSLHRLTKQDPALAARWQSLSIIPADFDRAAAAALWKVPDADAARPLSTLLNRSLLLHDAPTRRYRLHDLMRPLARDLFAPAEDPEPGTPARLATAQGRFALHFMAVLEAANELYKRDQDGVAAGLARYDADARNIAAAAAWAIAHAEHNPTAQRVAAELPDAGVYVLDLRLHQREWSVWLTVAAAAARQMGNLRLAANHLGNLGLAHAALGETRRAIEFHQQALVISREVGDRRGEGQ